MTGPTRTAPLAVALVLCSCHGARSEPVVHDPFEIRLGSFNIARLGQETDTDLPLVARIIDDHFDVITIEEIMYGDGGHPGYDALMAELGPSWSGFVTDRPRPDVPATWAEYYGILWRGSIIRPCPGWTGLVFHPDNPGGTSGTGENLFSREPAYTCLQAVHDMDGDPEVGFDFVLAAYHALYADGDDAITMAEVDHVDEVFASMASSSPAEKDLIIAGDFNLTPDQLGTVVDATILTVGTGSTLTTAGNVSGNLIDHVLVLDPAATTESAGPAVVLDLRSLAASNVAYRDTVSDHLPVMARFTVDTDDD